MGLEFKKLKKRLLIEVIVKSVICGVSAGLFAVGAVLLGLKLAQIDINAGYYVLIGIVAACLVWGVLFLLLRLSDKDLAKLIDNENSLNERIQTMIEFEGKEGEFIELQRKDALEKLSALPKRKIDIKKLWQYILIPVLSLALFITAVAVPAKSVPPAVTDKPFTYTERQKSAVLSLIADVESSSLEETDIAAVTTMLTVMSDALETADKESLMKSAVFAAVSFIDTLLYTSNSFDNAAYAISGERAEFISAAINDGTLFYKVGYGVITAIEQVRELENGLSDAIGENVDADMDVFLQQYEISIESGLKEMLEALANDLSTVSQDAVAASDDAIRVSLESFKDKIEEFAENIASYTDDTIARALSQSVTAFKDELVPALCPQSYRCIMDEFVRQRVAQIFGIASDELPRLNSGVLELDSVDDEEDDTENGGIGKGDSVYGSTELVYDPDTDEYVPYGTYINKYYANVTEQLLGGNLAENLQEYIKNYFSILYSGTANGE